MQSRVLVLFLTAEESALKRKVTFFHDDDFLCISLEKHLEDSTFPSQRQVSG